MNSIYSILLYLLIPLGIQQNNIYLPTVTIKFSENEQCLVDTYFDIENQKIEKVIFLDLSCLSCYKDIINKKYDSSSMNTIFIGVSKDRFTLFNHLVNEEKLSTLDFPIYLDINNEVYNCNQEFLLNTLYDYNSIN